MIDKTEVVLLTRRNTRNTMVVSYGDYRFQSQRSIRYLGVQLDTRINFRDHAELAANRALDACRDLSQILPNMRDPKKNVRRILACVVISRLLYRAPFWYPTIISRALDKMASILRRTMLRVACCYCTTSYEAATVISGIPPLHLRRKGWRCILVKIATLPELNS